MKRLTSDLGPADRRSALPKLRARNLSVRYGAVPREAWLPFANQPQT